MEQMSWSDTPGPTEHPPYTPPPGSQPVYSYPSPYPAAPSTNTMAIPALVLGILALPLGWIPFLGWPLPILATVFGALGLSRARATPDRAGYTQSVAGLVCGIIALLLALILMVAIVLDDDDDERRFGNRSIGVIEAPAARA